jgi:hypothetical protein
VIPNSVCRAESKKKPRFGRPASLIPAGARALLLEGFIMDLWESAKGGDAIGEVAREALRRVSSSPERGGGPAKLVEGR